MDSRSWTTEEVIVLESNATTRLTSALAAVVVLAMALAAAASAAPGATCGICGKNLIKNPGAEAGAGVTAVGAFGVVPGWTSVAGQFGAAAYTFGNGWFGMSSKGSPTRRKNYFFGGTTTEAVSAKGRSGGSRTTSARSSAISGISEATRARRASPVRSMNATHRS